MRHGNELLTLISQKGQSLLEVVVALALLGLITPLVLGGLSQVTKLTDHVYDRSVLFELAQSQLEAIESQPYSENASGYTLISAPEGYTITVTTSPVVTYTYAAPKLTPTAQTVQLVTVTVSGVWGDMELSRNKVRR